MAHEMNFKIFSDYKKKINDVIKFIVKHEGAAFVDNNRTLVIFRGGCLSGC